jgi:predicted transposase YbfD/YdcC
VVTNPVKNLQDCFSPLTDPRKERARRHELLDIIILAVCAVICDCNTWVDIAQFCRIRLDWFRNFLHLPNGIPSHDTFGRVFARLNPLEFEKCFILWAEGLREALGGEIVSLDGKSLRCSHDYARGKNPLQMVSAWAGANDLVLGQLKVEGDSNEITAIPALLKIISLKGCIVTIDAIGTQKEIAAEIRNQGADYVLALKTNQESLHEAVAYSFQEERRINNFKGIAHDYYETVEKNHGRLETRRYWTISDPDYIKYLDPKGKWQDLKSIGLVEAERIIKGETSLEARYYLSSRAGEAKEFAQAVRSHWGIENSLHWVMDVDFREDDSRVRQGYAAENFAVLRRLALNLIKREPTFRKSVKGRRLAASWSGEYLLRVLTSI